MRLTTRITTAPDMQDDGASAGRVAPARPWIAGRPSWSCLVACGLGLALAAPLPARAQEGERRCWVALRVTGPEASRVSEDEARSRLHGSCRAGDALVFLTDTGQPFGPFVALYCDMARPVLVERPEEWLPPPEGAPRPPVRMLTCTYRGSPRRDR